MLVASLEEEEMLDVVGEIHSRIAEIETLGNCFNIDSELSRFNNKLLTFEELSPELQRILSVCEEWKTKTDGLFDVSVEGKINLSGFLKGYALDEIRPILDSNGVGAALVNMGNSSVLAVGSLSAEKEGWEVENLNGEKFLLCNQCLTTSGNDSESRKHIINPLTGQYVEGRRLVSVVTSSGAEGEVASTVAFIRSSC